MHGTIDKHTFTDNQAAAAPRPITFPVTTFKQRERWSHRVSCDRRMTATYRHVLCALARCARHDENSDLIFDPTYDEIAEEAGLSRRTVIYAIRLAEEIGGIICKARHSDGRTANTFDLLLPNSINGERKAKKPS